MATDILDAPPASGREAPPAPDRPAGRSWAVVIAAGIAAAVIAAAISGAARTTLARSGPEGVVVARTMVGNAGTTVEFAEGGMLVFPPGSVDQPREVVVREYDPASLEPFEDRERRDVRAFGFEPTDHRFARLVTIVLPVPRPDRLADVVVVAGTRVDRVAVRPGPDPGTVLVRTRSFGVFEVRGAGGPESVGG